MRTTPPPSRLYRLSLRPFPAFSRHDFTLAWRMLVRYPGLSVAGVFGMAAGIAVSAAAFTIISTLMDTRVPLPQGDRVVSMLNWDAATNNRELRLIHDFASWRTMPVDRRDRHRPHAAAQPVPGFC